MFVFNSRKISLSVLFISIFLISGCVELNKASSSRNILIGQKPECATSKDCAENDYCFNGDCFPVHCPDGRITNHICEKYECTTDTQCDDDKACQNNKCNSLNCESGFIPENHKCIKDYKSWITPHDPLVLNKLDELTGGVYTEETFGKNLDRVYYYASGIRYKLDSKKWGVENYWQTSEQTIKDGTGDCEDKVILLQSLIEALLFKTYGEIPKEVAYVITGCVDVNYDGEIDGCHAWNIIDASKLPQKAFYFSVVDTNKEEIPNSIKVILDDVSVNSSPINPHEEIYYPSKDKQKTKGLLTVYWQGRKWVELEPTWNMPLSYYEGKGYPFVFVDRAFNSQEAYYYPDFVNKDEMPTIFQDLIAYLFGFLKTVYNYIVNLF